MSGIVKNGLRGVCTQRGLIAVVLSRHMASSAEAKPQRISPNLSYRPAFDSKLAAEERPVVLLYSWLVAKARHIHKYGDFYLGKGFDVLHVKIKPQQLMWPTRVHHVADQIMRFTEDAQRASQPILVHGFSVGGYLYGETLVKILSEPSTAESIGKRIRGQIFDSPVDFEGIPHGVGMAMTPIPVLQKTIKLSLQGYLTVFKNQTTKHYLRSSAAFHDNNLRVPTLFLYSHSDPVGVASRIEFIARNYAENGIDVHCKGWDRSAHVSHFHHHPVEYIGELNSFIERIGLGQPQHDEILTDKVDKQVQQL